MEMLDRRRWFIAAIALWGTAFLLGAFGVVTEADPFFALSFLFRRAAAITTLVWLIFTVIGAVWRRLRGK